MISLKFQLSVWIFLLASLASSGAQEIRLISDVQGLPSRIAFGSCADQEKPQEILREVVARQPELFLYLGDNIYGDTEDMALLQAKYAQLGAKLEFQALRAAVPTLAIWDDHDYGANDAGKEYPKKDESRDIFLDFWKVPAESSQRGHAGIFGSHVFHGGDRRLQVILLDTRTFRDPLATNRVPSWKNDYHPDPNPSKTLLGDAQWTWLAEELRKPADVRIIASSIQFSHEHNGWESWTNLPSELLKMIETIREAKAEGIVFVSGDVHWGEISVLDVKGLYPLHDVTASGINKDWDNVEPNQNRHGPAVRIFNFGMIEIDWAERDPVLSLSIVDLNGETRVTKRVVLSDLRIGAESE